MVLLYIRFFLRSLGLGYLAAVLPSVVQELLKSHNGDIDSDQ